MLFSKNKPLAPEPGCPDCRPVVVGNAERSIHTSQTMRQFKEKFRQILWPQQAAIGVKSGRNFVTTAIRTALQQTRLDLSLLSLDAGGYRPFVADHQWMSAIKRGCPGRRCMTCWGGSAARVERAAAAVGGESARDVEGGDVVRPPMAEVKMTRIAPASRVLGVLATDVESCCLRKSARCSAQVRIQRSSRSAMHRRPR